MFSFNGSDLAYLPRDAGNINDGGKSNASADLTSS